jgi:myo-inositol-1(or 4)-monophosphatase
MEIGYKQLLDCAVSAVTKTGKYALQNTSRKNEINELFQHDIKLALDLECQSIATQVIRSIYPQHAILGEEDSYGSLESTVKSNDYQWIIDPIDGTVNFSHGLSNWCCSIAVMRNGGAIAGAVYLPVIDELYTATIDQPAMRNGSIIHVSNVGDLTKSIGLTGLDKNDGTATPSFEIFRKISISPQKTRIMGSAAADMCQVACGRADGYYESGIYLWDVAAAGLIVERAGGKAEIIRQDNNKRISFIATNGRIHSSLRNLTPFNIL